MGVKRIHENVSDSTESRESEEGSGKDVPFHQPCKETASKRQKKLDGSSKVVAIGGNADGGNGIFANIKLATHSPKPNFARPSMPPVNLFTVLEEAPTSGSDPSLERKELFLKFKEWVKHASLHKTHTLAVSRYVNTADSFDLDEQENSRSTLVAKEVAKATAIIPAGIVLASNGITSAKSSEPKEETLLGGGK